MNRDHIEKHVRNQISKFDIPLDIEEAQKSNILISGTNHTGKSRLACNITSILQNFNWRIIVFDNSGIWKEISDLPTFYRIREPRNYDSEQDWYYPFPTQSMIFDISLLIPDLQKSFVNDVLERIWNTQVRMPTKQTLIVLEEFQLYGRNLRSSISQNLARCMSAGRNWKIRVLAVTVDLALVDPSFIRLCQQCYHGRLGIEANSKRRFRDYYGIDWYRIATEGLDVGYFIYLLRDKLKVIHMPLFEPKRLPEPYQVKPRFYPIPKSKTLFQRIKEILK